jgi:hypothetical protein
MQEYQVIYTDDKGNQESVFYSVDSLNELRKYVHTHQVAGKEFQIYQLVPVHTDWAEEFEKFVAYADQFDKVVKAAGENQNA